MTPLGGSILRRDSACLFRSILITVLCVPVPECFGKSVRPSSRCPPAVLPSDVCSAAFSAQQIIPNGKGSDYKYKLRRHLLSFFTSQRQQATFCFLLLILGGFLVRFCSSGLVEDLFVLAVQHE
jgi:hypothetical protein